MRPGCGRDVTRTVHQVVIDPDRIETLLIRSARLVEDSIGAPARMKSHADFHNSVQPDILQNEPATGWSAMQPVHLACGHGQGKQRADSHGERLIQKHVVDLRVQLLSPGEVDFRGRRLHELGVGGVYEITELVGDAIRTCL